MSSYSRRTSKWIATVVFGLALMASYFSSCSASGNVGSQPLGGANLNIQGDGQHFSFATTKNAGFGNQASG